MHGRVLLWWGAGGLHGGRSTAEKQAFGASRNFANGEAMPGGIGLGERGGTTDEHR